MNINIIVAVGNYVSGKGYPIGKDGKIPWHCSEDLKWFKETTMGSTVIMGRKTWESIGSKPLPGRINIVVSKTMTPIKGEVPFAEKSLGDAIGFANTINDIQRGITHNSNIFIIGGASLYNEALKLNIVDNIYIDFLAEKADDADTFFPALDTKVWGEDPNRVEVLKSKAYAVTYTRNKGQNNNVDEQYLNLVNEIIDKGSVKETRAGRTRSLFARQMRFNLQDGLPMLTTKKVAKNACIHELLWFLSGDTNIKYLVDNNVHIWDDDAYRDYCQKVKDYNTRSENWHEYLQDKNIPIDDEKDFIDTLSKEEFLEKVKNAEYNEKLWYTYGALGHVYGYQWRHWGKDQIAEVINKLKTNPDDRRLLVSAWNVAELDDMALPPCHYSFQFYTEEMSFEERRSLWLKKNTNDISRHGINVTEKMMDEDNIPKRKLSLMWNQRSVDSLLGLPFNILSYSVLLSMVAQCVNMVPYELVFNGGDCHVYENQVEIYEKEMRNRNPHKYALPKLVLNPEITNIDDFKFSDIKVEGYESYPAVKFPLSVG